MRLIAARQVVAGPVEEDASPFKIVLNSGSNRDDSKRLSWELVEALSNLATKKLLVKSKENNASQLAD